MLPNIDIYIYNFEAFFIMIKNPGLLPLKSPSFGLDRASNVQIARKMKIFLFGNFQRSIWVWMERWAYEDLIGGGITSIQRLDRWKYCRKSVSHLLPLSHHRRPPLAVSLRRRRHPPASML